MKSANNSGHAVYPGGRRVEALGTVDIQKGTAPTPGLTGTMTETPDEVDRGGGKAVISQVIVPPVIEADALETAL